jgi:hypothetical protein
MTNGYDMYVKSLFFLSLLIFGSVSAKTQVEFDPTTLPCGITTIDITYTDCPDWSGLAGMTRPGSPPGVLFPNGSGVNITNGQGSVDIEITPDAPATFELAIGTFVINDDPSNCMSVGYEYTETMTVNCDPCGSFSAAITSSQDETCDGVCDGEATVDPSGGDSPYEYAWDDPSGQTTQTATDLCAGTYTVTVTDANGCEGTASETIEAGPTPVTPMFSFDTD